MAVQIGTGEAGRRAWLWPVCLPSSGSGAWEWLVGTGLVLALGGQGGARGRWFELDVEGEAGRASS